MSEELEAPVITVFVPETVYRLARIISELMPLVGSFEDLIRDGNRTPIHDPVADACRSLTHIVAQEIRQRAPEPPFSQGPVSYRLPRGEEEYVEVPGFILDGEHHVCRI